MKLWDFHCQGSSSGETIIKRTPDRRQYYDEDIWCLKDESEKGKIYMRASNTHPTQIVSNVYNFVTLFIILILFINTTWTTVGYEHTGWRHTRDDDLFRVEWGTQEQPAGSPMYRLWPLTSQFCDQHHWIHAHYSMVSKPVRQRPVRPRERSAQHMDSTILSCFYFPSFSPSFPTVTSSPWLSSLSLTIEINRRTLLKFRWLSMMMLMLRCRRAAGERAALPPVTSPIHRERAERDPTFHLDLSLAPTFAR